MSNKSGNIFEQFIDKIALGLSGVICIWLLFTHVLGNPNAVRYQGRNLGPGQIDSVIVNENVRRLEAKLASAPKPGKEYELKTIVFNSDLKQSVKNIDPDAYFPVPGYYEGKIEVAQGKIYHVPEISPIEKVSVATVRMVAWMPIEEVSAKLPYAEAETRLEDLDLVTVEGQIDIADLYNRFRSSFAPTEQAKAYEKQYARPVFAKVQLQRQQMLDGRWSEWQDVPKTKISRLRNILDVPEDVNKLDYGIELSMAQFAKVNFRNEILQPGVYDDAAAVRSWISPSFYIERQKKLAKEEQDRERERLEAEKLRRISEGRNRNIRERNTGRQRPAGRGRAAGGGMGGGAPMGMMAPGGGGGIGAAPRRNAGRQPAAPRRGTARTRTRPTVPDRTARTLKRNRPGAETDKNVQTEEEKFEAVKLNDEIDISTMEKLVFWAHDDTTEPGRKYRYRIRIGLFNPVAGKDVFSDEQKDLRNKVILWSKFSEPTGTIETPSRLAMFPMNIREVDKSLSVQISKYHLGKWYSEDFRVKPGETIGRIVANKSAPEEKTSDISSEPAEIDYSTGALYIDAVTVTEWFGTRVLRPKDYYKMLYSYEGQGIKYLPVKPRFWPAELAASFREIKKAQDAQESEPLKLQPRGTAPTRAPGGGQQELPGGMPGMMPGMPPGMMPGGMMPPEGAKPGRRR